jgi:hypothetical protein
VILRELLQQPVLPGGRLNTYAIDRHGAGGEIDRAESCGSGGDRRERGECWPQVLPQGKVDDPAQPPQPGGPVRAAPFGNAL